MNSTMSHQISAPRTRLHRWWRTITIVSGALLAYAAVALLVTWCTGDPVIGSLAANVVAFALAIAYRWRTTGTPLAGAPAPRALSLRFWCLAALTLAACWLGGQSAGAWVYSTIGSSGLDATSALKAASPLWLVLLASVFVAPIGEESLVRGVAFPALRRHWGPGVSALATSLLFAVLHRNLVQIALALGFGILLAFVYEAAQRLWPVILMHVVFNMVSTLAPTGLESILVDPRVVVGSNLVMVLLLVVLWRGARTAATAERDALSRASGRLRRP